ncbi:MAG: hypothetical protein ACLP9L_28250, partial [Thermoguttaceae bacterium]
AAAAEAGGAAAAAAEAERRRQEEEEMTKYTDADLQGDWEFKIVRSNLAGFKNPEVLQQVCAEEARAGWTLVEKFDDQRLRFKRPIAARAGDSGLGFDPYRTQYGASSGVIVAIIVACALLIAFAIPILVILFTRK